MLITIFIIGYLAIVFEGPLRINKTATALLTGVLAWTVIALGASDPRVVEVALGEMFGEVAPILFFLLAAMTIVEVIDAHSGFEVITSAIRATSRRKLLLVIGAFTFVLSAILDNLTTTIVMVSLLRRLVREEEDRLRYTALIVIAANAGGVASPIGDVTTTMLWMNHQITGPAVVRATSIPALVSVLVPGLLIGLRMKGNVQPPPREEADECRVLPSDQRIVLFTGIAVLLFVPVFKVMTHLPPVMGILLGLGALWIVTELLHRKVDHGPRKLSVVSALERIDAASILFFLGILAAVGALKNEGVLSNLASTIDSHLHDYRATALIVGMASSVIDNVPLVAATQSMYSLTTFPTDHPFWLFLTFCAGTGGSILIIGSAAGIAAMGLERITFGWYLRHFSLPVLLGYLAGAAVQALMLTQL